MPIGVILFIAWMALEIVVVAGFIVWGVEQGHWKDIEQPKYSMLEDKEIAPWPGRELKKHELPQADIPAKE
jgi:hypothetical protein